MELITKRSKCQECELLVRIVTKFYTWEEKKRIEECVWVGKEMVKKKIILQRKLGREEVFERVV
jgi:hypothetical protein